jgi:hypothetical protein
VLDLDGRLSREPARDVLLVGDHLGDGDSQLGVEGASRKAVRISRFCLASLHLAAVTSPSPLPDLESSGNGV